MGKTRRHKRIDSQRTVLDRVLEVLRARPEIVGVVATGSWARGRNDTLSDLDISAYFRDNERNGRQAIFEAVSKIDRLLCRLWVYDIHALYLFENGVRLDLDLHKFEDLDKPIFGAVQILYDPEGVLASRLNVKPGNSPASSPKWDPDAGKMLDWFFWMFRQIYCWVCRGSQGGYRSFDKTYLAMESLRQVRDKMLEMRVFLHGVRDYVGNIDPGFAEEMASTFTRFDHEEMLLATRKLFSIFEGLCREYCDKTGEPYPGDKMRVMRGLFDEFDKIRFETVATSGLRQ